MHSRRQSLLSWLVLGGLATLSVILGYLQYSWIGELSRAERERLRGSLQTSLRRLSEAVNSDISSAAGSIIPDRPAPDRAEREREYANQWAALGNRSRFFRELYMAVPETDHVTLRKLDRHTGEFHSIEWPEAFRPLQERLTGRLTAPFRREFFGPGIEEQLNLIDLPYFARNEDREPGPPQVQEWLFPELNTEYLRDTYIPEMLRRFLGISGVVDYQSEIVQASDPSVVIYDSDRSHDTTLSTRPDAWVRLLDMRVEPRMRRGGRPGFWRGGGPPPGPPPNRPPGEEFRPADRGRWILYVRHKQGSLDAVVERARVRNLAVSMGILLLISAATAALLRFTRKAQVLAGQQMEFVAGVSHELRTPLSIMRTAGHNLQGRMSSDPEKVKKYGALIQDESEKLGSIVDQILRFSNARAGRVIGAKDLVSVGEILDQALEADKRILAQSRCEVEKKIDSRLPLVSGDATALRHLFQNLLTNAAKYGQSGGWIGVFATEHSNGAGDVVEVRIADRGPGIPGSELGNIFEPFYRGQRALSDQIHGTGLGLSLAKRIVEAHEGSISAQSREGQGTEFIVTLPSAGEYYDFANSAD